MTPAPTRYEEDELETIVEPTAPAAVHIDFVSPGSVRPRRDERGPRRDEGESAPARDGRLREERGLRGRGERSERGGRDRGGRGAPRSATRTGPPMKQLYPPADTQPEPIPEENGERKPVPFGKRRPSHGALFGGPGGRPPKGKVRQLYPPAPIEEATSQAPAIEPFEARGEGTVEHVEIDRGFDESGTSFEATIATGPEPWLEPEFGRDVRDGHETRGVDAERNDSLFVSSEEELEERRRRARERAEQRRLGDFEE